MLRRLVQAELNKAMEKYSCREIAERTGMNSTTVWRHLNDVSKTNVELIYRMEEAGIITLPLFDIQIGGKND